jgi:hypothetical protein
MSVSFKYVTKPVPPEPGERTPPLGLFSEAEYSEFFVGTDCAHPNIADVAFNWHFRIEGLSDPEIFPRQLDGTAPAYGTWFNPSALSNQYSNHCNAIHNWPMHVVQTENPPGVYNWDIFVAPYLGGSAIPGIEPILPLQGSRYLLQLYWGGSSWANYQSDPIPDLSPIFGPARSSYTAADLYPALYGTAANYQDIRDSELHSGIDIIPRKIRTLAPNDVNWDLSFPELAKVYAITDGSLYLAVVAPNDARRDLTLIPGSSSPYAGLAFTYSHIVPLQPLANYPISVLAGAQIATVNNHANDSRAGGQSHLHFEVKIHTTSFLKDPRQFVYPGLTP